MSDHALTYVSRKRLKIKQEVFYIHARRYRNFDELQFNRDANFLPWGLINECHDVNTATELLVRLIESLANKDAPTKLIKCRVNQPKWVTTELLSGIGQM